MGANVSTAFEHSAAATQRLQPRANSAPIGGNSSPPGLCIMDLLKPGCLKADKNKRKRSLTPEKKKMINIASNAGRGRLTTLEEWLLASPVGMKPADCFNGSGELYMLRHYSRRVLSSSSSSSRPRNTALASKARDSFCLERLVKNDEKADESYLHNISSISCRSQSGKLKKKVSFRLPEEADVIIFYPSEENRRSMMSTSSDHEDFV